MLNLLIKGDKDMYKKLLTAAMVLATGTALAIEPSNATGSFGCKNPGGLFGGNKFAYCAANITSATTSTNLGTVNVDPTKNIVVVHRSSVALSPTLIYTLDGNTVYSLNVSASTTPQTVNLGVPFFNGVTVSMSTPASISATNAISVTIVEN